MQQPGSSGPVVFLVPTRDISATGLSFLHGGFVHVGTRCTVQLITMHGTWNEVPAVVVRCQYVEGGVHEVAVRFDREIDPRRTRRPRFAPKCSSSMTMKSW